MEESVDFKNKINVFYVTIPSDNEDEHVFVNSINIASSKKEANITFYTSFINIDNTDIFGRIRYSLEDIPTSTFSGFTEPFKIEKIPNTTFTSLNITAEFVLEANKLVCFEIQLLKQLANGELEILDSKKCYSEINFK